MTLLNLKNLPDYDPGDLVAEKASYVDMWCVIDWRGNVFSGTVKAKRKEAVAAYKGDDISDKEWKRNVELGCIRAVKCAVVVPG